MTKRHIKILVRIDFPSQTVRFWSGSGPYMDANGDIWSGGGELGSDAIKVLQFAFAGDLHTFPVWMSSLAPEVQDLAYQETQDGDVIGSKFQVLIQDCDEYGEPDGQPRVHFTGKVIDVQFNEIAGELDGEPAVEYQVGLVIANLNFLRRLQSGSVLSDADQKSRSEKLNPGANPDKFCERVPLMADKQINWPRF